MLNYIMLTLCIVLGTMLSSVAMLFIMLQPKVMKWYAKKVTKLTNNMFATIEEEVEKSEDL